MMLATTRFQSNPGLWNATMKTALMLRDDPEAIEDFMDLMGRVVYYEFYMFLSSTQFLGVDLFILRNDVRKLIENQRLEAFLLHARILIDFFEKKRGKLNKNEETDVLAEDFLFPVSHLQIDSKVHRRLNRSLAHLSYDRLQFRALEKKKWRFPVFLPLITRMIEFIQFVEDKGWLDSLNEKVRSSWRHLRESAKEIQREWNTE